LLSSNHCSGVFVKVKLLNGAFDVSMLPNGLG
jgi:hypothetical protein